MKNSVLKYTMCSFIFLAFVGVETQASTKYLLTITNGSMMPFSPSVIYVKQGQGGTQVGQEPTAGFVRLCQSGSTSERTQELKNDSAVTFTAETAGLIHPGESRTVEVEVEKPLEQSIHFETMYGKTKDACAVGSIGSHSLYALEQHVTSDVFGKDNALQTGAFQNPVLPMGQSNAMVCSSATDAIACVRELALPNSRNSQIRFFTPYLPGLVNFLEMKYGAADVETLIIPSSGAAQFQLKLKH